MARTKSTARKSSGDKAPRQQLASTASQESVSTTISAETPPRFDYDAGDTRGFAEYLESTEVEIPTLEFQSLVREIERSYPGLRLTPEVLSMLQKGSERFLVTLFKGASERADRDNCDDVVLKDLRIAHELLSRANSDSN